MKFKCIPKKITEELFGNTEKFKPPKYEGYVLEFLCDTFSTAVVTALLNVCVFIFAGILLILRIRIFYFSSFTVLH